MISQHLKKSVNPNMINLHGVVVVVGVVVVAIQLCPNCTFARRSNVTKADILSEMKTKVNPEYGFSFSSKRPNYGEILEAIWVIHNITCQ